MFVYRHGGCVGKRGFRWKEEYSVGVLVSIGPSKQKFILDQQIGEVGLDSRSGYWSGERVIWSTST